MNVASPARAIVRATRTLSEQLEGLAFGAPVTHVYDPLRYARVPFERYVERYARSGIDALLLGMNPGPFGMAQTGVPFGEVAAVREWLGIEGKVERPEREHPRRPVTGFACARSEVSGARLWGWARARFGEAEAFFARHFVFNYCPLLFLEESGRNRTPDRLPSEEREPLLALCDRALVAVVDALAPRAVLGVGRFAERRARVALAGRDLEFGCVPHPSPASPAANRGWEKLADRALLGRSLKAVR